MDRLANSCYSIFCRAIHEYHLLDDVETILQSPYPVDSIEGLLYWKSWTDTVQWHLEDLVRDPDIDSHKGMAIKRRIDRLNQQRTNLVEQLDEQLSVRHKSFEPLPNARLNTESLGWAIDRLSILALKEYHVQVELSRSEIDEQHFRRCSGRKELLGLQRAYLIKSIDQLVQDIMAGRAVAKLYKQMKMYNDKDLNPVLYAKATPPRAVKP